MVYPVCKVGDLVCAVLTKILGTLWDSFTKCLSCVAMEDAHCAELNVNGTNTSFFGVYDGHGGII